MIINSGNRDAIYGGLQAARQHLEAFRRTLDTYGLNPGPLQVPVTININPNIDPNVPRDPQIRKIQHELKDALLKKFKAKPNFLFVLLPSDSVVLYDSIKFVCDAS